MYRGRFEQVNALDQFSRLHTPLVPMSFVVALEISNMYDALLESKSKKNKKKNVYICCWFRVKWSVVTSIIIITVLFAISVLSSSRIMIQHYYHHYTLI